MQRKVISINPLKNRYDSNAKRLLRKTCDAIESAEKRVAGYVVLVWNERGETNGSFKAGGMVSAQLLPTHVFSVLQGPAQTD